MKTLPNYKNPPLIEVVAGVVFERLGEFKLPHYGLLWQRFSATFPHIQHATPLGIEELTSGDPVTGLPLPRVWFINSDDDRLIQLQPDRLYYNWRSRPGKELYPRFDDIFGSFLEVWKTFNAFLGDEKLPLPAVKRCELTYINHIHKTHGWHSTGDLAKIFTDFTWDTRQGKRFLPPPTNAGWQASFMLPDGRGRLAMKVQPGTRQPEGELVLVFESSAAGPTNDVSENGLKAWFDVAHEWIVEGFADITNMDTQVQMWGRDDKRRS